MSETKINASQTTITAGDIGAATAAQGAKADTAVQPGDLATVATTGAYSDLSGTPTIPTVNDATITITQGGVTKGTFTTNQSGDTTVALDAGGNDVTSVNGKTGVVVLTASDVGALPDSTVIPDAQIQSDWDQSDNTKKDYIKNKPTLGTMAAESANDYTPTANLATVATTGSYSDLTNKPTIPAAQVNSDWDSTSGVSEILNKPTLATVATTGAYSDLSGKPTIPNAIQVSTMPTAAASEEGKIYQFIGTTDANYTNGYFYKCVSDGQTPATYSWTAINVQAGGGSSLPSQTGNAGKFLTTDGTDASWSNTLSQTVLNIIGETTILKLQAISSLGAGTKTVEIGTFGDDLMLNSKSSGGGVYVKGDIYPQLPKGLGKPNRPWARVYVPKINNGADIDVPTTGGTMVVATPPSADGTYVLKATVSSGVVSYAWVAE